MIVAATMADAVPVPLESAPPALLPSKPDLYGGLAIDAAALPACPAAFAALLSASLAHWRASRVRGVWLPIPAALSPLIPAALAQGFAFHHATPAQLVLTHWLEVGSPSSLPVFPSTAIGVGAFVLNAEGHLLVVQEKRGPAARPGFWKMVTGLVDRGEEIADAAVREVREETGLEVVFEGVVGFRHAHGLPFGDDVFFVCLCRLADPARAAELVPQASEIAAAQWMPLADFARLPHVADPGTVWGHLHQLCLQAAGLGGGGAGGGGGQQPHALLRAHLLPLGLRPGHNVVFSPAAAVGPAPAAAQPAAGGAP